jgi:hypothetical protein
VPGQRTIQRLYGELTRKTAGTRANGIRAYHSTGEIVLQNDARISVCAFADFASRFSGLKSDRAARHERFMQFLALNAAHWKI